MLKNQEKYGAGFDLFLLAIYVQNVLKLEIHSRGQARERLALLRRSTSPRAACCVQCATAASHRT